MSRWSPRKHWLFRRLFSLDPFPIRQLRLRQMLYVRSDRMNGKFCGSASVVGCLAVHPSTEQVGETSNVGGKN